MSITFQDVKHALIRMDFTVLVLPLNMGRLAMQQPPTHGMISLMTARWKKWIL